MLVHSSKLCRILEDLYLPAMVARTHKVWVLYEHIPVQSPVASAYVHILFYLAAIFTLHFVPGSSQYRRGNDRRPVVPRRSWSDREEAVLMVAMKDLVARGGNRIMDSEETT